MSHDTTAGRLQGRCALVTGAGGPMGRAVAMRFAREGAALALTDISGRRLQSTLEDVRAAHPRVSAVGFCADVTLPSEVDLLLADASARVEAGQSALGRHGNRGA